MIRHAWSASHRRSDLAWAGALAAFVVVFTFLAVPSGTVEPALALPRTALLGLFGALALLAPEGSRGIGRARAFAVLLGGHLVLALVAAAVRADAVGWRAALVDLGPGGDGLGYHVVLVLAGVAVARLLLGSVVARAWCLRALAGAGLVQAGLLAAQRFGADAFGVAAYGAPAGSVAGSFGHPAVAAGALLPLAVFAAVRGERGAGTGRWRSAAWIAGALLVGAGLGLTGSGAVIVMLGVVLLAWALSRRTLGAALLAALVAGAAWGADLAAPAVPAGTAGAASTGVLELRRQLWGDALGAAWGAPGQPWIGGGVAAGAVPAAAPSQLPGGVGNLLLDRWLAFGLPDALLWLALLTVPLGWQFRTGTAVGRGAAWAVVAFAAYYLVWSPVPQLEPLHLILLALCWVAPTTVKAPRRFSEWETQELEPDLAGGRPATS